MSFENWLPEEDKTFFGLDREIESVRFTQPPPRRLFRKLTQHIKSFILKITHSYQVNSSSPPRDVSVDTH